MIQQFNIYQKFDKIRDNWIPKITGELNGQYIKLTKIKDELIWLSHENEDEMFVVFKGNLIVDFKDRNTTTTRPGEVLIIPKGVKHRPRTNGEEVWVMIIEPKETIDVGKGFEWI
ncbi:cupin domain-containing protein [Chitinophagaceae bacterium LWZ2-11]